MGKAIQIAGTNSSVVLASSVTPQEIELPKLPNGNFPSKVLVQQTTSGNVISFGFAPAGITWAFGDGPLTAGNGEPQEYIVAPGANNFVHTIMITGTATLVVTPLG